MSMELFWAVIIIGVCVLTGYVVVVLHAVKTATLQACRTFALVERQMDEVAKETRELIRLTTETTEQANRKLHKLDVLFESAEQLGSSVHHVSRSVKHVSQAVEQSARTVQEAVHTGQHKIHDIAEWVTMGLQLLYRWQSQRTAKSNNNNDQDEKHKGEDRNGKQ